MNATAFLIAIPLGCSGLATNGLVCQRHAGRFRVPMTRASMTASGSGGSVGPSYVDESNENDDGGDGFFGDPGDLRSSMGIPMPPMSREERDWFLDAPDEKLRLERLKVIAKRRHNEQIVAQMKANITFGDIYRANSAGSYMDSLAHQQPAVTTSKSVEEHGATMSDSEATHLAGGLPERLSTMDFRQSRRSGVNAGGRHIEDIQRTGARSASGQETDYAPSVNGVGTPNYEPDPERS